MSYPVEESLMRVDPRSVMPIPARRIGERPILGAMALPVNSVIGLLSCQQGPLQRQSSGCKVSSSQRRSLERGPMWGRRATTGGESWARSPRSRQSTREQTKSTHTRHIFQGQIPRRLDAQEGRQFLDEGAESVRRRVDRAEFGQLGLDERVRDKVDRHGGQVWEGSM